MHPPVPYFAGDIRQFYESATGRMVAHILTDHIRRIWPDVRGLETLGYGYPFPWLSRFDEDGAHIHALTPVALGVHRWPTVGPGRVAVAAEGDWPFATESMDRILIVHGLEHADQRDAMMAEAWRVLKSSGRLMLIAPHRTGLWARADWTPFGHGAPVSSAQVRTILNNNYFVREGDERALFMPPSRRQLMLRSAYTLEAFGKFICPALSGVYIAEASKRLYGGMPLSAVRTRQGARIAVPVSAG